jgi:hypothetical protein
MSINSVPSPHQNDTRSAFHFEVKRLISSVSMQSYEPYDPSDVQALQIETPVNVGGTTHDMDAGLVTPFILALLGDHPAGQLRFSSTSKRMAILNLEY